MSNNDGIESKNKNKSDTNTTELTRRIFVAGAVGTAVGLGAATPAIARNLPPPISDYPFTLGVASGDPWSRAVVIWTRLAPKPMEGGGMAHATYFVRWEVSRTADMSDIVRSGVARARHKHGHSVHVDVHGLHPDSDYWYRFMVGQYSSEVGRTRTTPSRRSHPSELMFAMVSCQRYNSGFYTAYDDLVSAGPDLVVHLGDYIYESPGGGPRTDPLPESITLDEYRNRYGLYKSDPALIAAHQCAPWLFTWDDHEVENNYAGLVPSTDSVTPDPVAFENRRAAAYKAYWEHMPFRRRPPRSSKFQIYRRTRWGHLADFFVLDTRQYRSQQCGAVGPPCEDQTRQMLGVRQSKWLDRRLGHSRADWAVLAQQVVFSRMDFNPGEGELYNLDQWDGYIPSREQVLATMREQRPRDNIVLTGDIHASCVSDVLSDYYDPSSAIVGTEFVGTSISSGGSSLLEAVLPSALAGNPHFKWGDTTRRGWVKHTVTSQEWRADYRHVDNAKVENSPVQTAKSWVVPRGGWVSEV